MTSILYHFKPTDKHKYADTYFLTLPKTHSHIHCSRPSQLILISRVNVVIGANSQLGCRSHLAGGFSYTAASQTPHSEQTSTPASASTSNMFHKHVAQGGRRALLGGVRGVLV